MERSTLIASVAVGVTVAVGAFALTRAIATDDDLVLPVTVSTVATTIPVTEPPTTVAGASTTGGGATTAPAATSAPAAQARVEIDISNFAFSPNELSVAPGTEVVWTNSDDTEHSVLANEGAFASPPMDSGDTFSFTFTEPGVYDYICGFHPDMTASITVEG